MTSVTLRLPDDVVERIDALAARTGRTKTFYMSKAICDALEDLEDIYDAERVLEERRAGNRKTYSHEEMMREYGLDD